MRLERSPTIGPLFNRVAHFFADAVRNLLVAMPEGAARRTGRGLGRMIARLMARRARMAAGQAEAALGPGAGRHAREAFESFGELLVEVCRIPRDLGRDGWKRRIEIEGEHHLRAALAPGKGVIAVSGHLGNWEVGAATIGLLGHRLTWLLRPLENPLIQDELNIVRAWSGQHVITKWGGLREAIHVLRRGELLAMLADQDARLEGVFVPFFGRPASTLKSPAILSMRTGAPILPFAARRLPGGRHVLHFDEPYVAEGHSDDEAAVARAVGRFAAALEAQIRQSPGQWLWIHRRWKTQPPATEVTVNSTLVPAQP